MKRALLLIPAALLLGAASSETSFDGVYSGVVQVTPGLSSPTCSQGTAITATVKNGRLSAASPRLDGFVNIKAFVTGKMQVGDRALPFEGRVVEGEGTGERLSAGLIDDQTHCAWTIDLVKQSSPGQAGMISSAGAVR